VLFCPRAVSPTSEKSPESRTSRLPETWSYPLVCRGLITETTAQSTSADLKISWQINQNSQQSVPSDHGQHC
jgi:hypothetical protein